MDTKDNHETILRPMANLVLLDQLAGVKAVFEYIRSVQTRASSGLAANTRLCLDAIKKAETVVGVSDTKNDKTFDDDTTALNLANEYLIALKRHLTAADKLLPAAAEWNRQVVAPYQQQVEKWMDSSAGEGVSVARDLSIGFFRDPTTNNLVSEANPSDRPLAFRLATMVAKQAIKILDVSMLVHPSVRIPRTGRKRDVFATESVAFLKASYPDAWKVLQKILTKSEAKDPSGFAFLTVLFDELEALQPAAEPESLVSWLESQGKLDELKEAGFDVRAKAPALQHARYKTAKEQRRIRGVSERPWSDAKDKSFSSAETIVHDTTVKPTEKRDYSVLAYYRKGLKPTMAANANASVDVDVKQQHAAVAMAIAALDAEMELRKQKKEPSGDFQDATVDELKESKAKLQIVDRLLDSDNKTDRVALGPFVRPYAEKRVPDRRAEVRDIRLYEQFAAPNEPRSDVLLRDAKLLMSHTRAHDADLKVELKEAAQLMAVCGVSKHKSPSDHFETPRVYFASALLDEIAGQMKANGMPELRGGAERTDSDMRRNRTALPWFNYKLRNGRVLNEWKEFPNPSFDKTHRAQRFANCVHRLQRQCRELLKVSTMVSMSDLIEMGYLPLMVFVSVLNTRSWASCHPVKQSMCHPAPGAALIHAVHTRARLVQTTIRRIAVAGAVVDILAYHLTTNASALAGLDEKSGRFLLTHCVGPVVDRYKMAALYQHGQKATAAALSEVDKQVFVVPRYMMLTRTRADVPTGFQALCHARWSGSLTDTTAEINRTVVHSATVAARAYHFVRSVDNHIWRGGASDVLRRIARSVDAKTTIDDKWSNEKEITAAWTEATAILKLKTVQLLSTLNDPNVHHVEYPDVRSWYEDDTRFKGISVREHTMYNAAIDFFAALLRDCRLYERHPANGPNFISVALLRWAVAVLDRAVGCVGDFPRPTLALSTTPWTSKKVHDVSRLTKAQSAMLNDDAVGMMSHTMAVASSTLSNWSDDNERDMRVLAYFVCGTYNSAVPLPPKEQFSKERKTLEIIRDWTKRYSTHFISSFCVSFVRSPP